MFKKALILMFALEAISLASFRFDILSLPLLIVIGVGTFIVSFKRLEWGIYILFGELFMGSRGRLLEFDFISLRMVIFVAVFGAWAVNQIRDSRFEIRGLGWRYWLLLSVIVFGAALGIFAGNSARNVFLDANGYLYLLILPAVLSAVRNREGLEKIYKILAAAVLVVGAKTLVLFLWFAYGWPGVATLYHWVIGRDIGEITGIVGSASRIFMQSHFYSLVGLFIFSMAYLLENKKYFWVTAAAVLSIIVSLSRSLWLGGFAAAIFADLALIFYLKVRLKSVIKWGFAVLGIAALEVALLFGVLQVGGAGLSESVSSRGLNPSEEAAGGARLLLLPELLVEIKDSPLIGKGFGEEVTYKSFLPDRVTPQNPDGKITSFAFEWGYLDMLLKFGALGLVTYLLFIAHIFKLGWSNFQFSIFNFQTVGVFCGLVALVVLNITTPYLNHPLGIGYLILSYLSFRKYSDEPTVS